MSRRDKVKKLVASWLLVAMIALPLCANAHFYNVGPQSSSGAINTDSYCGTQATNATFPETNSHNTNDDGGGWDVNNQSFTPPNYYYNNVGNLSLGLKADFAPVTGNYTGSTQEIIRWAACKWGVDEDWAYAETDEESGWEGSCAQQHGGTGCRSGGDCGNADGDSGSETANLGFTMNSHAFTTTNGSSVFVGDTGIGAANADGTTCASQWSSYGIIQNKERLYEWMIYPMNGQSTAFSEDHRWAKWRACMNGNFSAWFSMNSDYLAAVSAANTSPNGVSTGSATKVLGTGETNLQYLALGCLGAHYSGAWYDGAINSGGGSLGYLDSATGAQSPGLVQILADNGWPGGGVTMPYLIWWADYGNSKVLAWPPEASGNTAPTISISGANTDLGNPAGVALDSSKNIWVADNGTTKRVIEFSAGASGNATPAATISGANTTLNSPRGIALDTSGNVWVADYGAHKVLEFTSTGNVAPATTITPTGSVPAGIVFDGSNNLYITADTANAIQEWDASNRTNTPSHSISGANTTLNNPIGITLDASGNIWVANYSGNTLLEFTAGSWGNVAPAVTISGLTAQPGIAVDQVGNIYTSSYSGNSIKDFAAGSSGAATPVQTVSGASTTLSEPYMGFVQASK
jgi:sugar lactone lactonase YvrE